MNNKWLMPCPFCGQTETLEYTNCKELESCRSCNEEINYSRFCWAVVCSFNRGGCGATGGFRLSKEKAQEAWNVRTL